MLRRFPREDWIALALLAVLVIVAFANVVFCGRSLVPSDSYNPLDYRLRGPDPVPAEEWTRRGLVPYPNFRDLAAGVMQSDPSREVFRQALEHREFPFWDPYIGGGAPSFASLVPSYLFPPTLLLALLGNGRTLTNVYILLLIFSAGATTYFFLRRHVDRWASAFGGAALFMLSGTVVLTAPAVMGQPLVFFSLPLLVTARLIERPGRRRGTQLALAFAFVATATFPPALLLIFASTVIYLVVSRPGRRAVAWFVAGAAVSLAVTAAIYLPAILLMRELTHIAWYYAQGARDFVPPKVLLQIISAKLAGGVDTWAKTPVGMVTGWHMYYTGIVALFLGAVGIVARAASRARPLQVAGIVIITLSTLKLVGLPPVQWLEYVPLVRSFHYAAYLGMVIGYWVAVLGALGIDALISGRARAWQWIASGAALGALMLAVRMMTFDSIAVHPSGALWLGEWERLVVLLALAVIACRLVTASPARAGIAMLLIVIAAEGVSQSAYPRPRRWNHWSQPPAYIRIMLERNSGGRVLPLGIFPANLQSVYRVPTLDSILTASRRIYELYREYFGPIPSVILRESSRIPPERVLDVANIEYFTIYTGSASILEEAKRRGYETLYADDYMHLVRRTSQPRYTFTSRYEVADAAHALRRLTSLPAGTVLLEQAASFAASDGPGAEPRLVALHLNDVEVRVNAPRPGLLVCSESDMSGWTATVDGRRARILPANYAFRAVEVPAGAHTVRFTYRAPGWDAGVAISIAALLLCLGGLAVPEPRTED